MAVEPTSSCKPVIKNSLSVLSKIDVRLSPALWFAVECHTLDVCVPPAKSEPLCNIIFKFKELPLSLFNVPVVSPTKVLTTLVQLVVTENSWLFCLLLSASSNSNVYVAEALPLT